MLVGLNDFVEHAAIQFVLGRMIIIVAIIIPIGGVSGGFPSSIGVAIGEVTAESESLGKGGKCGEGVAFARFQGGY